MGGEGGGAVKVEEAEHKLVAIGSLVVQRVHAGHGSDALSPSSLPLVSYLSIQHPCEIGAWSEVCNRRGLCWLQCCRTGAPMVALLLLQLWNR